MADHSTLRPDSSSSAPSTKAEGWGTSADASRQISLRGTKPDFTRLVAQFAASDGAGLSPELSADLALQVVLNAIVNQACLATSATGAAVALRRGGELICRASCGDIAPELGSCLDPAAGLTGICMQTGMVQICDDAQFDPRADLETSRKMGVRSVMVMPLLKEREALGVFELFSPSPFAFGERDEVTVGVLVRRVLENIEKVANPPAPTEAVPVLKPDDFQKNEIFAAPTIYQADELKLEPPLVETAGETAPRRRGAAVAWAGTAAIVACAVLLSLLVAQRARSRRALAGVNSAKTVSASRAIGANADERPYVRNGTPATASAAPLGGPGAPKSDSFSSRAPSLRADTPAPEGSLLVYENGKEVFRMTPSSVPGQTVVPTTGMERASSVERDGVLQMSPAAAEDDVLYRIEPQYPEEARQQQLQGAVVLEVRISRDGAVQDIALVGGQPLLAQAATDAVKQWRFKTRSLNGRAVEMQTRITLNFKLPR
jgi:TonB family protein